MALKTQSFTERITPFLLIVVVAVAFGLGILWQKVDYLENGSTKVASNTQVTPVPSAAPSGKLTDAQLAKIPPLNDADHVRGATNPKIYLIVYSDLECPYCKEFHTTLQELMGEYNDQVAWVYRHFPLSIHPQAQQEAEAVECAAQLNGENGFWDLTDKIFEVTTSNNTLDLTKLPDYAQSVGLNKVAFQDCLDSGNQADRVNSDYQGGIDAGITGTPGTFIVTSDFSKAWLIPGSLPYASLKLAVDEALQS